MLCDPTSHFLLSIVLQCCVHFGGDPIGIVEVHMVELQLSSLLEIKAWIKISVSDFYKQFLIFAIQWNPSKPDPHEIGILSLPNLFFGPKISVIHFLYFLTSVNRNPSLPETGPFFQSVITY